MRQWWRRRQITHKQSTELMLPIRMLRDFPDSKVRLLFLRRKRICDLETLTTRQRHQHFSLAKRTLLFFSNDEQSKVYMMVAASCFDGRDLRHRPAQVSWGEKSTPHQSAGAGQLVQGPCMRGRQMAETTTDTIRFAISAWSIGRRRPRARAASARRPTSDWRRIDRPPGLQ